MESLTKVGSNDELLRIASDERGASTVSEALESLNATYWG